MKNIKLPDNKVGSVKAESKNITRKEAIKKTGKYAALTAATTLMLLSSKESAAQSLPKNPGWGL